MTGIADALVRRDGASKALAVVGALLALLGGVLLYSREGLAVDYYDRGNVLGVANVLNGLEADAEPAVRTLP